MRSMPSPTKWAILCTAISVQLFVPERASPQASDKPPGLTLHAETRVVQIEENLVQQQDTQSVARELVQTMAVQHV